MRAGPRPIGWQRVRERIMEQQRLAMIDVELDNWRKSGWNQPTPQYLRDDELARQQAGIGNSSANWGGWRMR